MILRIGTPVSSASPFERNLSYLPGEINFSQPASTPRLKPRAVPNVPKVPIVQGFQSCQRFARFDARPMCGLTRKNSSSEENGGRIFYRYHSTDHHQRKRASASKQHEVVSIPGVQRRAERALKASKQSFTNAGNLLLRSGLSRRTLAKMPPAFFQWL
jgi:hypothetical protein